MKNKIIVSLTLIISVFLTSCPEPADNYSQYYNPGAQPFYVNLTVENDSSVDCTVVPSFTAFSYYEYDGELIVSKYGLDDVKYEGITVYSSGKTDEIEYPLCNNELIMRKKISMGLTWISCFALEFEVSKTLNGSVVSTEKITGLPVDDLLCLTVRDNYYGGLEEETFAKDRLGYYYIDTDEKNHPDTYGKFVCTNPAVNGTKSGVIKMTLKITDSSYSVIYSAAE